MKTSQKWEVFLFQYLYKDNVKIMSTDFELFPQKFVDYLKISTITIKIKKVEYQN